jgi:hypothetical protein
MSDSCWLEFSDRASGIRGWIGKGAPGLENGDAAVLLFEGADVVLAERTGGASLDVSDEVAKAEVSLDAASIAVEVRPAASPGPLRSGPATVELDRGGEKRSLECPGAAGELVGANGDGGLVRSLVAVLHDGSALSLRSARPGGAQGHSAEHPEAWLLDPDGTELLPVNEPLLSTQYDADGDQMRAGLELWIGTEDQAPLRGSGARVCGTRLELGGWNMYAAFFDWTVEGVLGSGGYLIWRG